MTPRRVAFVVLVSIGVYVVLVVVVRSLIVVAVVFEFERKYFGKETEKN